MLSALVACPGALTVDLGMEGDGVTEDDDEGLGIDLSAVAGVEFVNVQWDPTLAAEGEQDCTAEWLVAGSETTDEDTELCPSCDYIWQVTFTAELGAESCMGGPGLPFEAEYVRKLGIEFDDVSDIHFRVWRNIDSAEEPLLHVGVGAVDPEDASFSWSGHDVYEPEGDFGAHSHHYSGEGAFGSPARERSHGAP